MEAAEAFGLDRARADRGVQHRQHAVDVDELGFGDEHVEARELIGGICRAEPEHAAPGALAGREHGVTLQDADDCLAAPDRRADQHQHVGAHAGLARGGEDEAPVHQRAQEVGGAFGAAEIHRAADPGGQPQRHAHARDVGAEPGNERHAAGRQHLARAHDGRFQRRLPLADECGHYVGAFAMTMAPSPIPLQA
jgi:hypothetical protein